MASTGVALLLSVGQCQEGSEANEADEEDGGESIDLSEVRVSVLHVVSTEALLMSSNLEEQF